MGLPIVYRKSGEQIIASYSFLDIFSQTGIITLYPFEANDNYILATTTSNYADVVAQLSSASNATTATKQLDLDFDLMMTSPQTLKGTCFFNIPLIVWANTGGSAYKIYSKVRLRKYDGTTETEIANGDTETYAPPGTAWPHRDILSGYMDVPITDLKRGDYLRITIEIWGWNESGDAGQGTYGFGNDPVGRVATNRDHSTIRFASGDVTTTSIFVPFRIDL